MTNKKEPTQEELAQAVAKDYYLGIQSDLSKMSPGQLDITKKALQDFEAKRVDNSQKDFERRIARMNNAQFEHYKQFGEFPEDKR